MTTDRILGGIAVLCGGLLLLWGIPANVTATAMLFPNPALFPKIAAWLFIGLGLAQMAFVRTPAPEVGTRQLLLFAAAAGGTFLAMILIDRVGYLVSAIGLMAAICAITGERRPFWTAGVVLGLPVAVWLLFEQVLNRPLP
jgi:hypothetical protein